ncbi:exported hypothetical protein [Acidobacteriia bacterium SbA2]|nr:exported hypothetical protein [Acidobacteriia bacterium SbA2]
MKDSKPGVRLSAILLAGGLISVLIGPVLTQALSYGRLAGIVSDDHGNPLMGATVMIVGPLLTATAGTGDRVERVITDAKGKFSVGNLIPGWYSLQIVSPTRIPARKSGVKVEAGQTSTLKFVLADAFAPLRFQVPDKDATPLGDDWKWVLRTSAATRPILRYHHGAAAATDPTSPEPADQRLLGVVPGPSGQDPMASDQGMGTVFAYLRHLSPDSDLMTVGSVAADGSLTSSEGTVYRKGLVSRDTEEVSVVLHQLGYLSGLAAPLGPGPLSDYEARGLAASYTQTCALNPHLTLTAGVDVDFLDAVRDLLIAQPRMKLAYHVSRSTDFALQLGKEPYDESDTLIERVNALNAFPVLTLRGYQPEFEQLQHSEVSLNHRFKGSGRLEIAAYHDGIKNAAVWSPAQGAALSGLAGNYLPNPAAGGVFLNMGDYRSTGYRVAYAQRLGNHVETLVAYFVGDSLNASGVINRSPEGNLQGALKPVRSPALAARMSARIPVTRTRVTTSYEWVQSGRVTMVDPQGQADMQLQPFLDFQVRQPLPALAFLPAHIEAVADFRNFLAQGYAPMTQPGESALLLGSAYKCIRGGLSVEF